jgi:hypothetical protein
MKILKSRRGSSGPVGAFIAQTLAIAIVLIPLSYWTRRNLDFWITHFKGHAVYVPLWLAALVSLICNAFALIGNVIGELGRYLL